MADPVPASAALSRIGIDLGGTKIEIAVLDAAGTIVHRARVPTPQDDYAATIEAVAALVGEAQARQGCAKSIGVGTPGSVSPRTRLIRNSNSQCLNGRDLQADLSGRLGVAVRLANDANCFALSEAHDGAGAGARTVFGVILGTGVGGGLVVDGRLIDGPNAIAGEWGHNPLAPEDRLGIDAPIACYCGRPNCVETFLCGPALARLHRQLAGESLSAEAIAERGAAGDAASIATIERYAARLAQALANVINIVDPDVIVLGGGVSNIDLLYECVPRLWGRWIFSDFVATRLARNIHGDSSGVRGAAWLAG
jgi:fructokinase